MAKNILVVTGSPRRGGNSDRLAEAFITGARKAGHTTHKFEAAFKHVRGCLACDRCWSVPGVPCVQRDDFAELAPLIETCQTLVLASPVYFWGFSSQLKTAQDRFYAYLQGEGPRRMAIRESALLLSLGDTDDATWRHAAGAYRDIAAYCGWKDLGVIVAKGVSAKGDVERTDALARAEALGRTIA